MQGITLGGLTNAKYTHHPFETMSPDPWNLLGYLILGFGYFRKKNIL